MQLDNPVTNEDVHAQVVASQASSDLQTGAAASEPALTPDQIAKRAEPGFYVNKKLYDDIVKELDFEFIRPEGVWTTGGLEARPFINVLSETSFSLGNPDNPIEIVELDDDPEQFERLRSAVQGAKATFDAFGLNLEDFKLFFVGNGAAALTKYKEVWLIYTIDWRLPTQMNVDHPSHLWTQTVSTKPKKRLQQSLDTLISVSSNYYNTLRLRKQELEALYGFPL